MNIYKISQSHSTGYDTYDAAIVAAPDENAARQIHPVQGGDMDDDFYAIRLVGGVFMKTFGYDDPDDWFDDHSWAPPEHVRVELLGTALPGTEAGVLLASFKAG